jgi:indole-3-glycerol phosphate synthase
MLTGGILRDLILLCGKLNLTPVVEIFDTSDLRQARAAGASVILVNNRDLQSLRVDTNISHRLVAAKEDEEFWIAASGMRSRSDLLAAAASGFDAALIGTALMRGKDPGAALTALLQEDQESHA